MSQEGRSPEGVEADTSTLPEQPRGTAPHPVDWFGLTESNLPQPPAGAAEGATEPELQVPFLSSTGGLRP
jgi:hypothetical protein